MRSAVYQQGDGEARNEKEQGQIEAVKHSKAGGGGYGVQDEINERQCRLGKPIGIEECNPGREVLPKGG